MSDQKIELLAPAGDFACFQAALNAGADAVYLGGEQYGARAYAGNFSSEEIQTALHTAHLLVKRFILPSIHWLSKANLRILSHI